MPFVTNHFRLKKQGKKEPEYNIIHGIADQAKPEIKEIFQEAVNETENSVSENQLREEAQNPSTMEEIINMAIFTGALIGIREVSQRLIRSGARNSTKMFPKTRIQNFVFDEANDRMNRVIQQTTGELIENVSMNTQRGIRAAILRSFDEGLGADATAKIVKNSIGLTERQAIALQNIRRRLEEEGLTRREAIRISNGKKQRFLNQRAENIARTETIRAASLGQQELFRQMNEQGFIDDRFVRVWIVTGDDRTCPICIPLEGKEVGIEDTFVSATPQGRILTALTPPIHPSCRCAIGTRFKR